MKINRTTKRTIDMIDLISKHKKGLTLKEIMQEMDIPQTSAFDILQTLLVLNVIEERYEEYKYYTIGIKAYEIGMAYSHNKDIIQVATPYLEDLGEKLGKTTFIGILDDNQVSYVYKYEPSNAIVTTAKIGTRNEIYCTSLGKAILAFIDEKEQKDILKKIKYVVKTSNTITNKEDFIKELKKIKEKGYAVDDRELEEHIFCLGVPVFNHNEVVAAISATGMYKKEINLDYETDLIKKTADRISQRLGKTR